MAIIDSALIGALHVVRQGRESFDHDPGAEHAIWQTSSIDALLDGAYEGDLTFAELAAHGDFGIGTVQHLDGEMVGLDGEFFNLTFDGAVTPIAPETRTPFAVVCRFAPGDPITLDGPLDLHGLARRIDDLAPADQPILAVRVDGQFESIHLRSVPRQSPPYPPLHEVVARQREWTAVDITGSLIGFRFPDYAQGIDVAGYHLHFLSEDRRRGGHVTDLALRTGQLWMEGARELHLEVPAGVVVAPADPSAAKAAAIRAVEGS